MPTESHNNILDRDLALTYSRPASENAAQLLRELTNFGTHVLQRSQDAAMADKDAEAHFAPLALYRHVLELTDAIEVLVRNSCAVPAMPLVRATFEAMLALAYIHQDDSAYKRRSLSWAYVDAVHRARALERWIPGSALRLEFERERQKDPFGSALAEPNPHEVERQLEQARAIMADASFAPCAAELERIRTAGAARIPRWYSLFGGPTTLEGLARSVGLLMHYRFQYRHWSKLAHAEDPAQYVDTTPEGQVGIRPLRQANEILSVTLGAANHSLHAMWLTIARFSPVEKPIAQKWYVSEVRTSLTAIRRALRVPGRQAMQ